MTDVEDLERIGTVEPVTVLDVRAGRKSALRWPKGLCYERGEGGVQASKRLHNLKRAGACAC